MTDIKQLHDTDFNLWIEQQAKALQNRDVNNMDWDNLLDEIEDMGSSNKRSLKSYTMRLIEHIFKLQYWHSEIERNKAKWRIEVTNFRSQIETILDDSPSLKRYLEQNYFKWYAKSVNNINSSEAFVVPEHQPIPLEELLADNYFGNW